jgi:hypothetical protein
MGIFGEMIGMMKKKAVMMVVYQLPIETEQTHSEVRNA